MNKLRLAAVTAVVSPLVAVATIGLSNPASAATPTAATPTIQDLSGASSPSGAVTSADIAAIIQAEAAEEAAIQSAASAAIASMGQAIKAG